MDSRLQEIDFDQIKAEYNICHKDCKPAVQSEYATCCFPYRWFLEWLNTGDNGYRSFGTDYTRG